MSPGSLCRHGFSISGPIVCCPWEKCPGKFQLCSIHQTQHKLNISHSQESQQGSQKVIFSYSRQFQRICEFQDDSDFAQAELKHLGGMVLKL